MKPSILCHCEPTFFSYKESDCGDQSKISNLFVVKTYFHLGYRKYFLSETMLVKGISSYFLYF